MSANYHSASVTAELVVVVHGSPRTFKDFPVIADFAERNTLIVLSSCFRSHGDGNADDYRYIEEQRLRYDKRLLHIVAEEASARTLRRNVLYSLTPRQAGSTELAKQEIIKPRIIGA